MKNNMNKATTLIIMLLCIIAACEPKEKDVYVEITPKTSHVKEIAIVTQEPLTESQEKLLKLSIDNFEDVQLVLQVDNLIKLNPQIYLEKDYNLEDLAHELKYDTTVYSVIGLVSDENINKLASAFIGSSKALVMPNLSNDSILRNYAVRSAGIKVDTYYKVEKPFLWSLKRSDLSLSATLTSHIATSYTSAENKPRVGFLLGNGMRSQTLRRYLPFHANEFMLDVKFMKLYDDNENNIDQIIDEIQERDDYNELQYMICDSKDKEQISTIVNRLRKDIVVFFTEAAYGERFEKESELDLYIPGITPCAYPSTGFDMTMTNIIKDLKPGDSRFYDSMVILETAAIISNKYNNWDVNQILSKILCGEIANDEQSWDKLGMFSNLRDIFNEGLDSKYIFNGASGPIVYNSKEYTTIQEGCYALYVNDFNNTHICEYMSNSGQNNTIKTIAAWDYRAEALGLYEGTHQPEFELKNQWAVLICGSTEFKDIRHQADVLNFYQTLKENNYPDDHIILIVSGEAAKSELNPFPGEIRAQPDGPDLLKNAVIDYKTEAITPDDICKILLGQESDKLPTVLKTDENSNILIYWSGHGQEGKFCFNFEYFTEKQLMNTLKHMYVEDKYRRIFLVTEPCHSGQMISEIEKEKLLDILAISSCAPNESSWADYKIQNTLGKDHYMSDSFTNNILKEMKKSNYNIKLRTLFTNLAQSTVGSHVKISNSQYYGSLSQNSPYEFMVYTTGDNQ